jgi:hypothetical protein
MLRAHVSLQVREVAMAFLDRTDASRGALSRSVVTITARPVFPPKEVIHPIPANAVANDESEPAADEETEPRQLDICRAKATHARTFAISRRASFRSHAEGASCSSAALAAMFFRSVRVSHTERWHALFSLVFAMQKTVSRGRVESTEKDLTTQIESR